jgi:hypothetical protein
MVEEYIEIAQWDTLPCHDMFNRFRSALDPKELESAFVQWIKDIAKITEGEVVSIDGKSLSGGPKGARGGPKGRVPQRGGPKGARGSIVEFLFFMIALPGKNAAH